MKPISDARHRFPSSAIQQAVRLYLRFMLSYRAVEELLAERGLVVSYETVRQWALKFGPAIARRLRRQRQSSSPRWHLDEMVIRIGGERHHLCRAVDDERKVLDVPVQRRRNRAAIWNAFNLLRHLIARPTLRRFRAAGRNTWEKAAAAASGLLRPRHCRALVPFP